MVLVVVVVGSGFLGLHVTSENFKMGPTEVLSSPGVRRTKKIPFYMFLAQ